ncbi:MAG: FAD-binding protein [Planctomycetota bacterium]
MDHLYTPLQQRLKGVVYTPDQFVAEHHTNFGHIHQWTPRFVVEPQHADDIVAVIQFAREHQLHVSTRGSAHSASQLGISNGGILLAMKSMSRILTLDEQGQTVDVEAGVMWRDLVHHLKRWNLYPRVLTNNLSVTVGGTLSIAGIGVASFKYSTQGDNVAELDVVTGAGERVTCSPDQNSELFWNTIAGLGQVGIITRARLVLRRAKPMTRSYYLLYDNFRTFMEDSRLAMDSGLWDHMESWASPCPQGTKPVEGRRQVFARWFYPFHLTVEFDPESPPDDAELLKGLSPYDHLYSDDLPTIDFVERLTPVFELWKKAGTWEHVHPWMEVVLPWDTAADYVEQVLPELPPGILIGGHALVWPAKGVSDSRLFMRPPGDNLIGFGILPAIPAKFWPDVQPMIDNASRLSILMGGKRYLSGYIHFSAAEWRQHFGEQWQPFYAAKRKYDPDSVLNPGFVPFDVPEEE